MKYCAVILSHLGRKMYNTQGNNIDHLGAALVATYGTFCAKDVFPSNHFVHIVHFIY